MRLRANYLFENATTVSMIAVHRFLCCLWNQEITDISCKQINFIAMPLFTKLYYRHIMAAWQVRIGLIFTWFDSGDTCWMVYVLPGLLHYQTVFVEFMPTNSWTFSTYPNLTHLWSNSLSLQLFKLGQYLLPRQPSSSFLWVAIVCLRNLTKAQAHRQKPDSNK